jgi:hypothetical protein
MGRQLVPRNARVYLNYAYCIDQSGIRAGLIVDSSGMKFGRASKWHRQKYGRDAGRTPWRKMHLSIDPEMNMHGIAITGDHVSDEVCS